MFEQSPRLVVLYTCGCHKNFPLNYIKDQIDLKDGWRWDFNFCSHKIDKKLGRPLRVVINFDSIIKGLWDNIYKCHVCGDLMYCSEAEAEISEPKLCSQSCANKFSH